MNEKTKKLLMKESYMGVVALFLFVVVFVLCSIFPSVKEIVIKTLTKDTDIKKLLSLFKAIAKEIM